MEDATLLALKMEEGTMSQGMWAPLEAEKAGKKTLSRSLQKELALRTLWLQDF